MRLYKTGCQSYPPIVQLPCAAAASYKPGQALVISGGVATIASGTTKPSHICYQKKTGAEGEFVDAILITAQMEFATKLSAEGTSLAVGNKVTIHTDGEKVTATTASGVATIVSLEGTEVGSTVIIRFE